MCRRNTVLAAFIVLAACGSHAQWTADRWTGTCSPPAQNVFYEAGTATCQACPTNATYDAATAQCVCSARFATSVFPNNGTLRCVACALNEVVSQQTRQCIPCGNPTRSSGSSTTVVSQPDAALQQLTLVEPSTANGTCSCPANAVLIETVGATHLGYYTCLRCNASAGGQACIQGCPSPKRYDTNSGTCVCEAGYTQLSDGTCAVTSIFDALTAQVASLTLSVPIRNLGNSGANGPSVASWLLGAHLYQAAYHCRMGDDSQCNALANFCVLTLYDLATAPCILYRALQTLESCRGTACEVPTTMPWLYYLRASPLILQSEELTMRIALEPRRNFVHRLEFVLSSYSWNGTWLGNTLVTDQFSLCDIPSAQADAFNEVGANRKTFCWLNQRWYLKAPETQFHELFIRDSDGRLVPVPVLLDWSNVDLAPQTVHDPNIYREGEQAGGEPAPFGYRRRFYFYDNIGAVPDQGGEIQGVNFARRIMVLVSLQQTHSSRIFTPLMIIQYTGVDTSGFYQNTELLYGQVGRLRTNRTEGPFTTFGSQEVKFSMSASRTERALMITLTTFCCLCFFSAWARTYGWMRRQQNVLVGMLALMRFILYACNHVANCFTLIVVLTSGWFYLFYKHQSSVEFLLPDSSRYLFAMLYTAVSVKGVYVIYRLLEQCKIDWFVIDWERSRGTLLRENKEAEVTMWRSTFVANELNELQVYRIWNPLFCIVIIMAFLEGLRYRDLAMTVPAADTGFQSHAYIHPILVIAVDSFFWIVVPLVFYFLQHHIYYRFIDVHPLRGFIDVCSVSNISIIMLLESNWGYYIHGESIHAHADASMAEFQENLRREAQGNLPQRGLGGNEACQVFEVFIGEHLRWEINTSYQQLWTEYMKALGGAVGGKVEAGKHRSLWETITGSPGQVVAFTEETLHIKKRLNDRFKYSVRMAEKTVSLKSPIHRVFDFPPNLMYMNGPYAGERAGQDLFYVDEFDGWSRCLLAGLDMDLFVFYLLMFCAIDSSLLNAYISVAIVYILDLLLVWFRQSQGQANLGAKTMFDERFFV